MASNSLPDGPTRSFDSSDGGNKPRTKSVSETSEDSQTAAEFISSQLQLEADAREALPYKFDTCSRPLGALRQLLFACLTCNPPPANASDNYTPAAVCYSCSVQCHGEHTLVELFNKRNFVCDCGTTRLPSTSPCNLRINPTTNQKGGVASEPAQESNKYNQNFQNKFCGCECDYDAHKQKGTMFQCLGLGSIENGGCGEDWWHPGCVVGLGPTWYENDPLLKRNRPQKTPTGTLESIKEEEANAVQPNQETLDNDSVHDSDDEIPTPPGFPNEDDFDGFICYKCVDAFPWIKRYAGTDGFLMPVFKRSTAPSPESIPELKNATTLSKSEASDIAPLISKKRKLDDEEIGIGSPTKRLRDENSDPTKAVDPSNVTESTEQHVSSEVVQSTPDQGAVKSSSNCRWQQLPPPPDGTVSLFFKSDFREKLCRCSDCFPKLAQHPQLLEEEDTYEPPVSEDGEEGSTVGSGSLLDRGERALTNMDRVKAIEGVMAYNHLKEKLTPFFKEFAESGKAISAEDIKAHFAKLRGDAEAIRQAGEAATHDADNRREQSGY